MFRLRPLPAARYKILPKAAYFIGSVLTFYLLSSQAGAQTGGGTITLRSDVQEANSNTGIITARGNVQIDYPLQQIYATSAQAQYYSRENRMVLSGDVLVRQEGNTLRAETVTYLIDEGRFVALPEPNQQVETTYILPAETSSPTPSPAAPPAELTLPPLDE
ncbi:LptA/OstA family protein [Sphaerothrix gracilis]|uniref:LptA/OstA family protein n=1 Tax=Sphaerothrix gracilis TaxID=3151835 RepID=UPI0031FC8D72